MKVTGADRPGLKLPRRIQSVEFTPTAGSSSSDAVSGLLAPPSLCLDALGGGEVRPPSFATTA